MTSQALKQARDWFAVGLDDLAQPAESPPRKDVLEIVHVQHQRSTISDYGGEPV